MAVDDVTTTPRSNLCEPAWEVGVWDMARPVLVLNAVLDGGAPTARRRGAQR